MLNGHHDPSIVDNGFQHFELVVVAIAGKFILVAGFDEFGAAAFNGNA